MTPVPFLDLKTQYSGLRGEIEPAVLSVLASGQYALGPEVTAFEEEFAHYCGSRAAVACNSGTSALHLALLAAGVGPGDEVITIPMTFVATVAAIRYVGATPVFVDVCEDTWTLDPEKLAVAITSRTKAIMPVHLHGLIADMQPILDIAKENGIVVIEDAAQAHGAEYNGRRAGSMGAIGCFSFYPGKNLGACGEGGILVSDDDEAIASARKMRDWGQSQKYHHDLPGFNYRMDAIQGAVLRIKLRHIDAWTEARRSIAALYDSHFSDTGIQTPVKSNASRHVYHVYAIVVSERQNVVARLNEVGIGNGIHYPIPVHLQKAHADLGHGDGDFPVSERLANSFLSLPIYPEMPAEHVETVVSAVLQDR